MERKKRARTVAIGVQDFETLIVNDYFYVDKTAFIKEWWENGDSVTLIARPRRFGKTLTMSMLEVFFSNRYTDGAELFEGLTIWQEEEYQKLQGTYPVLSMSFANIKETTFELSVYRICQILQRMYAENLFLSESEKLSESERKKVIRYAEQVEEKDAVMAMNEMSYYLMKHFGRKVIILLDEYDTPMQEAYVHGYWEKFTSFIRNLFNATFKTNPYFERAVMTGITRVSKESIFSDLNNLSVITTTSNRYATAFGFTEEEVFAAMDELGLKDKAGVKHWYDGFVFGGVADIYNPWSIINYLKCEKLTTYWANTSSNSLVGKLIRESGAKIKTLFEDLLKGKTIDVPIDEQIVYNNLDNSEGAIWSLMLATGYLKVIQYQSAGEVSGDLRPLYRLSLTNEEVKRMFFGMVSGWFEDKESDYEDFLKALLTGDVEAMNEYMQRVTWEVFSFFDTGMGRDSSASGGKERFRKSEPERFYHGFVLGLIVKLSGRYHIRSNRESGFGRYDIILYPQNKKDGQNQSASQSVWKPYGTVMEAGNEAIIIEFKVRKPKREKDLEATVQAALQQIEEKHYDTELKAMGFVQEQIKKYGFAFEGKEVLIGGV